MSGDYRLPKLYINGEEIIYNVRIEVVFKYIHSFYFSLASVFAPQKGQ